MRGEAFVIAEVAALLSLDAVRSKKAHGVRVGASKAKWAGFKRDVFARTVFDEERERNDEMLANIKQKRESALRESFDTIIGTKAQLRDLGTLIDARDWVELRKFVRLYNDAVVRKGMSKVGSELRSREIEDLCVAVNKTLESIDGHARRLYKGVAGESEMETEIKNIYNDIENIAILLDRFQQFRP